MLREAFNLMTTKRLLLLAGVTLSALGCTKPQPATPKSPDDRIRDILEVARTRDASAVPELIEELDHSDVGVRYCAILSLERITGTRLGFRADSPAADRRTAILAWRAYADQSSVEHTAAKAVNAPPAAATAPETAR